MTESTFVFKTAGDRKLQLLLRVPDAAPGEKRPLLICVTGGGWMQCVKEDILWFVQPLPDMALAAGFAVASIEYRLASEVPLETVVTDAMDAVRYLVLRGDELGLDASRMAVCGHSAGAHLALLLANAPQEAFVTGSPYPGVTFSLLCCMAFAPPTVLYEEPGRAVPQGFGWENAFAGRMEDDGYRRLLSPMTHLKKTSPRTMLVHGDRDPAVFYENSLRYLERAASLDARCTLLTVSGGGHSFETLAEEEPACPTAAEAYGQAARFLLETVTPESRR